MTLEMLKRRMIVVEDNIAKLEKKGWGYKELCVGFRTELREIKEEIRKLEQK